MAELEILRACPKCFNQIYARQFACFEGEAIEEYCLSCGWSRPIKLRFLGKKWGDANPSIADAQLKEHHDRMNQLGRAGGIASGKLRRAGLIPKGGRPKKGSKPRPQDMGDVG